MISDRLEQVNVKNVFNSLPVGIHIYRLDKDGRLIFIGANPAADRILSVDNKQFIGMSIEEAFPPLIETEVPGRYRKVAIKGKNWKSDRIDYKDEQISCAYEVNTFQIAPMYMAAAFIDITDRKILEYKLKKEIEEKSRALKKSEEFYRLISENANDLITVFDDKFKFEYINEKIHTDLMGYTNSDLIGKSGDILIHPDDQKIVLEKLMKSIETGEGLVAARIRQKSGKYIWTETKGKTFSDKEGKKKILLITRDISERIIAENKVKEAYNRADLYRSLFAHDIGNILMNIKLATELCTPHLKESDKIDNLKELFQIILEQITRGDKLIRNVQMLTTLDDTKFPIKKVDTLKILNNAIEFLYKSYPYRQIEIIKDFPNTKIDVLVNDLLLDVIENILINSVRHNSNQLIEIKISMSKTEIKNIKYCKIEIIDNGKGIHDKRKKHIFERKKELDKHNGGLGIGLSLVKKIIDSYKGKIWVEDRVAGNYIEGSKFIVLIPKA